MIRQFLLLFSFVFFRSMGFAQVENFTLQGYLGVEGGESYSYKLEVKDSLGTLSGFGYTYLYEGKEVKASVKGWVDKPKGIFSFQETNIIYNRGFESNTTICLIHATLHFKKETDGSEVFSGSITSADAGNVYCGQGAITFPYSPHLKQLMKPTINPTVSPIAEKAVNTKPMRVIYDTLRNKHIITSTPLVKKIAEITEGHEQSFEWQTDSIVLKIWDGGRIDGDMISIRVNDELVIQKLTLSKDTVTKRINFLDNNCTLTIIALNEGSEPPNTANLLLLDGNRSHEIIAFNEAGKQATIHLRKVRNP
ncbi:MAG: hypothetical protein JST52_08290 [Bacteroidetes bacterium]|nr:hypothetical protein [Bacteroidota bacterium]MBS1740105.1 hypothetical protein [Bacteroidota bacterium]